MPSNYPPGVTGNEFHIAGYDREWEEDRYCEQCDEETTFLMGRYRRTIDGSCGECGHDIAAELDEYIDPDAGRDDYDRWGERV